MNKKGRYFTSPRLLFVSLVIVNAIILLISFWYYEVERKAFIRQKISQLNSIAEIKIDQAMDWRNERLSDARYLSASPQIKESFRLLLSSPENVKVRSLLYDNLNGMFLNGKYESMVALDRLGNVFFSIPGYDSTISKHFGMKGIVIPENIRQIQIGDLALAGDSIATLQIMVPQFNVTETDSIVLGWLALNINLNKTFFPLLETIPIPSESMEVALVYRDNGNIFHLNKKGLPDIKITSLKKITDRHAGYRSGEITAFKGTESGLDERGVTVLAVNLPIPESRSFLVVKMDKSEAYAEVRKLTLSMITLTGLMILAFSSSISFFWMKQRNELKVLETEKKMILERFDMLSKFANDAIIVYTDDLTILQVNDKALELYGYRRDEILGMSAELLRSPETREEFLSMLEITRKEGGYRFDTLHNRKDGTMFPVDVSLRYMELMGSPCFQALVRDITQRKQFEKALIEGEERLRLITNTMPQIVWTAKPDGSFDFVNSRFEVLTGSYPFKENFTAGFIHENDREEVIHYWKEAIHDVREHQIRLRIRMKDGTFRWFLCLAIPMCSDEGKVIRWYGSATDIDELENRVAQRTAELSDLYNNAPCGYHSLDINGTFININDTALKWLGYSRDELVGKRVFSDLITEESRKAFTKDFRSLKHKGFIDNLEYDMVRLDGTLLPVLLSATAVKDKDNNIVMTRTTMIDHTVRKHHENEILNLNAVLQEHGVNLEYANRELEAFIFSVSHDLRAPLRAINGFSQILLDDYQERLDKEGRGMLEKVWGNANRMRQLIEDLLRLSRTGRQELSYARIDMKALFNSMIEETRQLFPERNIKVNLTPLPKALGDLALLKQVISNLLSNAVKFSGKKECSEIEIGSLAADNNEVTFYVKDNGTGFDMSFSQELFGVFRRLNNAADYEGTGVGLALVKRIIDKHAGRVWAYSEPGNGATFYFSLPGNKADKNSK